MTIAENATVKIFRFDPSVDTEPRYETFSVPPEAWNNRRVIDVIRYIYENFAPGLSFREPCRRQVCGACMIRLNNKPAMACDTVAQREMTIEPMVKQRVIKDLIIDLGKAE